MKAHGATSRAPITEALGRWTNLRIVLLGLAISAAQGVVSYSGQVYVLYYLEAILKVDNVTTITVVGIALFCGMPMVVGIGWLSDRIGRKWLIMSGCVLFVITASPIFRGITHFANPALEEFQAQVTVRVSANDCNFRIFVTPATKLTTCDRVKDFLTRAGVNYQSVPAAGDDTVTTIGAVEIKGFALSEFLAALKANGYPLKADPQRINFPGLIALLLVLTFYSSLVYGPLAAFLVEHFPPRIRLTSVSVAYNIGTGWFGGLAPLVISALAARNGNIYAGLFYPVVIAGIAFVIGSVFIRDKRHVSIGG